MATSDKDREYWRKLASASKELEEEPGSGPSIVRKRMIAPINKLRAQIGARPAVDVDEHPPELGFHELAKSRGLLRRDRRGP